MKNGSVYNVTLLADSNCTVGEISRCCYSRNTTSCRLFDLFNVDHDFWGFVGFCILFAGVFIVLLFFIVKGANNCVKTHNAEVDFTDGVNVYSTANCVMMLILWLCCNIKPSQQILIGPDEFGRRIWGPRGESFIVWSAWCQGSCWPAGEYCARWDKKVDGGMWCCAKAPPNNCYPKGFDTPLGKKWDCGGAAWGGSWNDGCWCWGSNTYQWCCSCHCYLPLQRWDCGFKSCDFRSSVTVTNHTHDVHVAINHTGTSHFGFVNVTITGCTWNPVDVWYDGVKFGDGSHCVRSVNGRPLGDVPCHATPEWGNVVVGCACPGNCNMRPLGCDCEFSWHNRTYVGASYGSTCDYNFDWYIYPVSTNCTWFVGDCWHDSTTDTCGVVVTSNGSCLLNGKSVDPGLNPMPCQNCEYDGKRANGTIYNVPTRQPNVPTEIPSSGGLPNLFGWLASLWKKYEKLFVVFVVVICLLFLICMCFNCRK